MSLTTRRILYIFFIFAFLVITPWVCFYAAGYKFGPRFKLQKTGSLAIKTDPSGAQVYLNGKIQRNFIKKFINPAQSYITTPTKMERLRPGKYEIKLILPGYWPWQKKITVQAGKITFFDNIVLFKKTLPLLLLPGQFNSLAFSPDKKYFITTTRKKIIWFDLDRKKAHTYPIATSSLDYNATAIPLWSSSGKKIIFGDSIFTLKNWLQSHHSFTATGSPLAIKWAGDKNDLILYKIQYQSAKTKKEIIYQYDLNEKKAKKIAASESISDFIEKNNHLLLIKQEKLKTSLILTSHGQEERKINLPYASYIFINPERKLINLYDCDHQILYLIDPTSYQPLKEILTNVNKTAWLDDERLIYANNFEIWLLNLKNGQKTLLTRFSQPIKKIIAHPNSRYLFYSTTKEINIIELSPGRTRNIVNLIKLPLIREPTLGPKGEILYFYAQIGQQKGIYKLAIQ